MDWINAYMTGIDPSFPFCREVSCFWTPEHGAISLTTGIIEKTKEQEIRTNGCGGAVDFDWFSIWDFLKNSSVSASKAIMMHTHPKGMPTMSSTDLNMVQGWRLGLGIPIVFTVATEHSNGNENLCSVYYVDRDKNDGEIKVQNGMLSNHERKIYLVISEVLYGLSKSISLESFDLEEIKRDITKIIGYL